MTQSFRDDEKVKLSKLKRIFQSYGKMSQFSKSDLELAR